MFSYHPPTTVYQNFQIEPFYLLKQRAVNIPYILQPIIKKSMSLAYLSSDDLSYQVTLEILSNPQIATWFKIFHNEFSIPSSK